MKRNAMNEPLDTFDAVLTAHGIATQVTGVKMFAGWTRVDLGTDRLGPGVAADLARRLGVNELLAVRRGAGLNILFPTNGRMNGEEK